MTPRGALALHAHHPRPWTGRYARIPGDTTVLHVRRIDGEWWPVIDWARGDEIGHCRMVEGGDVDALARAVCAGKRALGSRAGGSFLINEFGRVLVPATDRARTKVVSVGECSGPLLFANPFEPGRAFDLADVHGLRCGDPWERPYVGIPHNLSGRGEIYFKRVDERGITSEKPDAQDDALIAALRRVRPSGPVRFIVGAGGVLVTKVEPAWEPRYVGRITHHRWFSKEV